MAPDPNGSYTSQIPPASWASHYRTVTGYILCLLPLSYLLLLVGVCLSALDVQHMGHWAAFCGNAIKFVFFTELVLYISDVFLTSPSSKHPGIPLIREPEGATSFRLRTRLAYYTDAKNLFREAYEKASTCLVSRTSSTVLTGTVLQAWQNLHCPWSRFSLRSHRSVNFPALAHIPRRSRPQRP